MIQLNRTVWKIVYSLGNLQLAIFLLLIIAILSSLGTIIEQDKNSLFYEINYPVSSPVMGFLSSDTIFLLGLDHIYTSSWFLLLLVVFGSSLVSCTFSRQVPSLKLARIKQALTGYGNADKSEVQEAVARELDLEEIPKPDDAADALAVALTAWYQMYNCTTRIKLETE